MAKKATVTSESCGSVGDFFRSRVQRIEEEETTAPGS